MTTLIIKSSSDKKTRLIVQLAEELGLSIRTSQFEELDINAMVKGIGRKTTDEELVDYLSKDSDAESINIDEAFSKYENKKP